MPVPLNRAVMSVAALVASLPPVSRGRTSTVDLGSFARCVSGGAVRMGFLRCRVLTVGFVWTVYRMSIPQVSSIRFLEHPRRPCRSPGLWRWPLRVSHRIRVLCRFTLLRSIVVNLAPCSVGSGVGATESDSVASGSLLQLQQRVVRVSR